MGAIIRVVLLLMALSVPAWADPITGMFVEQDVYYHQPQSGFGPILPYGTILEMQGVRMVGTTQGWQWIEHDWLTRATAFTAVFGIGTFSLFGPSTVTEADPYTIARNGSSLDVFHFGWRIGHADLTTQAQAVPEPAAWLLMLVGLILLLAPRRICISQLRRLYLHPAE